MKSTIAATALAISTVFTSTALAAKFEAGALCHSNRECEANCVDGQFTFAQQDGGSVFVCDSGVTDPVQWYQLACVYEERFPSKSGTKEACDVVGGKICGSVCIASGKRSEDEEVHIKWANACPVVEDGKSVEPEFYVLNGEAEANKYCE
jgi:hypothetical protein